MKFIVQILMLLLPLHFAHGAINGSHIVVFGVAETEVRPDEMKWSLSVKSVGPTAVEVSLQHITEVDDVLKVLAGFGLGKDEVETTNMQLNENWVYRNNSREKNGYFGLTSITFKTKDFSSYIDYWSQLTTLKNVSVSGVSFDLSNRTEIADQTKVMAIKQGREKAVTFAAALNSKVGAPLVIEEMDENGSFPRGPVRAMAMESDTGGRQAVSPGKEVVRARVKLVFSLE
ncbi:MAG: hypothetical protein ACI8ZB_001852 [Desulforhopalus sp.]|jgi:uncharacterized protein YggE